MIFTEVSNEQFEEQCETMIFSNLIHGTDYSTSYETLNTTKLYGHMIFSSKAEAMAYLKNKGVAVE
ncbi:hypothetical protein [Salinicoccus carnicancri]|uniref:hypothetical protein n=1 Tax=Salinicoccus carnicancri TaxID=558170 RepID=UPI00030781DA|nr:hypothetical protein [Salinicoccus carnicancri]